MRIALAAFAALSLFTFAASARADESAPQPNVQVVKPVTIYARHGSRPSVVVVLQRPSAAHEAGVAHESLRASLMQASAPSFKPR